MHVHRDAVHHDAAHQWFAEMGSQSWATCPITENGYVRIASHPNYPNRPGDVQAVLAILRQFCMAAGHHFWREDTSVREMLEPNTLITHIQITDLYLLGLAVQHRGKLATFDHRIPTEAVRGGGEALELIVT